MDRFVSKRSSSSLNLDSSPLDDVRTERAAIAPSVGLGWPPVKRRRSAGRPSWQQLWERALQDHILEHHELPRSVRLQREKPSTGRSHTRSSLTHRLPVQLLHSLKTSPAAVGRSAARSRSTRPPVTGSSTCWTSGGQNGDGACSGACAWSSGCAPGCSTGSTRTLLIAGSGARHEQRRAAGEACCRPQT